MILKQIDPIDNKIKVLQKLSSNASDKQKALIEQEIYTLRQGHDGEKENAYHIDFYLKDSENTIILHDIRIVHNGLVFQTDHLVINRLGIYSIESKNFSGTLSFTNGQFQIEYKNRTIQIENPLLQNERHIFGLKKIFKELNMLPDRFKVLSEPPIFNKVIISSNTTIKGPMPKNVVRPEEFFKNFIKESDTYNPFKMIASLSSLLGKEEILDIANKIISLHTPLEIDYSKKYRQSAPHSLSISKEEKFIKNPRVKSPELLNFLK